MSVEETNDQGIQLLNREILLSICIPVYNCGEFIGAALDSISTQLNEFVQVVIYDGASTDDTSRIVESYTNEFPNIKYRRGLNRGGIDVDLALCLSHAKGKYCWLFSGDDVMRAGAINRILSLIKDDADVYICRHTICDRQLLIQKEHKVLEIGRSFRVNFGVKSEHRLWFKFASTTEAFFSFMSGLVIKNSVWQSNELPDVFVGTCWGHVARLFGALSSGLTVVYVHEILLDKRGENDSFADKGVVNRYRIGIAGYHDLAQTFFGANSFEAYHIMRTLRNEFTLRMLLYARLLCRKHPISENAVVLDGLVKLLYSDKSFLTSFKYAMYRFFPLMFYSLLRTLFGVDGILHIKDKPK